MWTCKRCEPTYSPFVASQIFVFFVFSQMQDRLDVLYDAFHQTSFKYLQPIQPTATWSHDHTILKGDKSITLANLTFSDNDIPRLKSILAYGIHSITMFDCRFSTEAMRHLCTVLLGATRVTLCNISTSNDGLVLLQKCLSDETSRIKSIAVEDDLTCRILLSILSALHLSKIELLSFKSKAFFKMNSSALILSNALMQATSLRGISFAYDGLTIEKFAVITASLGLTLVERVFISETLLMDEHADSLIKMIKTPGSRITTLRFYECKVDEALAKLTNHIASVDCQVVDFGLHDCECTDHLLSTMTQFLKSLKTTGKVMDRLDMGYMPAYRDGDFGLHYEDYEEVALCEFAREFEGIQVRAIDVTSLFTNHDAPMDIMIDLVSRNTPSMLKMLFIETEFVKEFKRAASDPNFKLEYLGEAKPKYNSRIAVRTMMNCKRIRMSRPGEVVQLLRLPRRMKYDLRTDDGSLDDGVDYEAEGEGDF